MNKTERQVAAIKNGTVIDHIPADKTYQVANLIEGPDKSGNHRIQLPVKEDW